VARARVIEHRVVLAVGDGEDAHLPSAPA
jgi:hypothetical protein